MKLNSIQSFAFETKLISPKSLSASCIEEDQEMGGVTNELLYVRMLTTSKFKTILWKRSAPSFGVRFIFVENFCSDLMNCFIFFKIL